MGQGNTIVSHFVVQRADFIVAIACVPCGLHHSLTYACEWGFLVCWKLSAAEQIKPDCCRTPAVVSIFDWLRCLCPVLLPLHTITLILLIYQISNMHIPRLFSKLNGFCYTQCEATATQKSARKWRCDLSRLLARKITKGIHSCKPASLNDACFYIIMINMNCIICTVTDGYNVWVPVYHCVYAGWYVLMCVCVCVYAYVGGGGWAVVCWLQL